VSEIKYRRAEEMMDSGVEWIGKTSKAWKIKKLKHFCVVKNGATPKTSMIEFWDGNIEWYTPTDFIEKYLEKSSRRITKKGFNSCGTNLVSKGSILITCRAPIGNLGIIKSESASYNQGCKAIIPENVINKYVYYMLLAGKHFIQSRGKGTTFMELSSYDLNNLQFMIQIKDEQEKIANFLDIKTAQFDSIISKKELLIKKLEEAKKCLISEVVTGKVKIVDGEMVKREPEEMKDSGVEWLGMIPKDWKKSEIKRVFKIKKRPIYKDDNVVLSLTQKGLKIKNLENNDGQHAKTYSGYQEVKIDDFVMNHMDLLTGYVDSAKFEGVTSPDYRVFQLINHKDNLLRYYLYFFQMCYKNKIFYGYGQGVSNYGRWRLQTDVFNYFPILKIPYKEQIDLVSLLEQKMNDIENINDKLLQEIIKLKQAKQSLISEAVTGKIDLRDWEIIEEGEQ
jgi:type I restriction enzyme S subunit